MAVEILFPNGQIMAALMYINDPILGRIEWNGQVSTGPITIGAVTIDGQPIEVTVTNTTPIPVTASIDTSGLALEAKQDVEIALLSTINQAVVSTATPTKMVILGAINRPGGVVTPHFLEISNSDPSFVAYGLNVRIVQPLIPLSTQGLIVNAFGQSADVQADPVDGTEFGLVTRPIPSSTLPQLITAVSLPLPSDAATLTKQDEQIAQLLEVIGNPAISPAATPKFIMMGGLSFPGGSDAFQPMRITNTLPSNGDFGVIVRLADDGIGTPVTGTFFQTTQPVSIELPVEVTGTFFQTTQPVSIADPVPISSTTLATQATLNSVLNVLGVIDEFEIAPAHSVLDRLIKIEQAILKNTKSEVVSSKQIVAALASRPQSSPSLTAFRNTGLR